jgi:hypothetical protein
MSSIVLNVKLNAIASDSAHMFRCVSWVYKRCNSEIKPNDTQLSLLQTESVNTIFTEAKLQSIAFEQWPLWIADRLIGSNPPPHHTSSS